MNVVKSAGKLLVDLDPRVPANVVRRVPGVTHLLVEEVPRLKEKRRGRTTSHIVRMRHQHVEERPELLSERGNEPLSESCDDMADTIENDRVTDQARV
jgi:hypothetical protein